jgi:hypothetical protein
MSQRSVFARSLVWLAASFALSTVALAAPAKRPKPSHAKAAPKSAVAPDDGAASKAVKESPARRGDETAGKPVTPAQVELDDERQGKPETKAPVDPDSKAPSDPDTNTKATALSDEQAALEPGVSPVSPHGTTVEPSNVALTGHEDETRGEVARLAAGRVEVAVSASVDMGRRHFTYSDPVGPLLAPYRLPVVPMASFGLEAYPFASTTVPVVRDLGLRGRVSRAFGVASETPGGAAAIETSWTRFGGELRERTLVPGSHPFELGLYAGADASYFGMTSKTKVAAFLPAARTVSLRFGVDTRLFVAWRLSLMLGGAYLVTTSPGEIYDRFRNPHVAGLDADFGASVALTPGFEARLTARYTRYFASFKPALGDPAVAGGALDEQMQFGLGVRYAH